MMMLIHRICIAFRGDSSPKQVDSAISASAAMEVDNCKWKGARGGAWEVGGEGGEGETNDEVFRLLWSM